MQASKSRYLWKKVLENKEIYIMLLPGLLFLLVVKYLPMYGLQVAFKRFDPFVGVWNSQYVGFTYFIEAFKSDIFWRAFKNTIIISFTNGSSGCRCRSFWRSC